MPRRTAKNDAMPATSGRKTIDDLQQFARANALPVPDGYLASGESGTRLADGVTVVEVRGSDEPIVVRGSDKARRAGKSVLAVHDAADVTRGLKMIIGPAFELFGRITGARRASSR